jgi:glutaredoxin
MTDKARTLLFPHRHNHVYTSTRPRCPICKAAVYSLSLIHPQCAVIQLDMLDKAARKAELLAAGHV